MVNHTTAPRPTPRLTATATTLALALVAALVAAAAQLPTAHAAKHILSPFACDSVTLPASKRTFDLSSIHYPLTWSNLERTPPTETRTTLLIDLCNPLPIDPATPQRDQCPPGTRICILIESIKDDKTTLTQAIPVAWSDVDGGKRIDVEVDHDDGERGFTLELPGATYADRAQKAEVELICDPRADQNAHPTSQTYDRAKGKLHLKWPTKFACSSSSSTPPKSPSSGDGGGGGKGDDSNPAEPAASAGWGFFSWLFFLVSFGFLAYMALGAYNNYNQYGASGWDLVPHRDFWRESPYIARDAASHMWRSIAGGSGSGSAGGLGFGGGGGGGGGRGAYEPL
ncbi:uncharacterized protein PFL1_02983 [Pseudozyma flocculosa PF-1]|uniref:Autophagy-related protein 27 n=2 Tax=Pseudozyma flocculosa TaxID=84751 RepID=A0A5C3EZW3_9BASI|nr:uncharacterized protein PFL1_02983 [Pseudozyma flocculosa PF-1]EPQ29228.1 hypothetical protein PFL1_02983 [Pseudozyma flocculosa PF-1]SPO37728.1 uncharacterized protein PSFLO_03204 [Pseudozyma flocculosa]